MLNVEKLSTGDEVLHGQIIDTNAAWLADFFFNQGLPLKCRHTVGDDLDALVAILRERSEHADVLIVNGGLGPTSDDLSALAAATAKGEGLILHQEWLETMTRFFAERGRPMAASNRKQAEIPQSAGCVPCGSGPVCGVFRADVSYHSPAKMLFPLHDLQPLQQVDRLVELVVLFRR